MAHCKLYYGSGDCSIESGGIDIQGVEIRYQGAIEITKTCGDDCIVMAKGNGILVLSMGNVYLSNLFSYIGEIKIKKVVVSDKYGVRVPCSMKKVMDYSELLRSNIEDMTEIVTESLSASHVYKTRVNKTTVNDNIIKNQHSKGELYLKHEIPYTGSYHILTETGKAMTGAEPTDKSVDLFIKKLKIRKTKTRHKTKSRTTTGGISSGGRSGGTSGGGGGY